MEPQQDPPSNQKSKIKRKRERERETSPESPVQEESIKVKVTVIHEHPNKTPPAIGYYPSGFDPAKFSGSTNFQLYRNKNMPKRLELVVKPAAAPVEFVGTNYSGEAAAGHRGRYALGVFDKEAKTLKIMPIAGNKIFRLEPKVKGVESVGDREPSRATVEELSPQERALKLRQTADILGTKRENERIKKRLALKQDDEPDSQKNLDAKMKTAAVNHKAIESTEAHVTRNIPPHDASATTPQGVYDLDKIILKGEWDHLEDIYNILQKGEAADFKDYPLFIQNRIVKLKNMKDESEKKKLSCIFSYLNHLIKFKDQYSMDGVSSSNRPKIPQIFRHKFTSMFDVSDSKRLPTEKINLLNSYILVLTLHIDEFKTEYKDISKDLRMNKTPVTDLYKHLGCQISTRTIDKVFNTFATLTVPLKFPDMKTQRKKR